MADTVVAKVIQDGPRNVVLKLTGISDGTGETAVTKLDLNNLLPVPGSLALLKADYNISGYAGLAAQLFWEGAPNELICTLSMGQFSLEFDDIGGLSQKGVNTTGNIILTTTNANDGDTYTIILHFKKKFPDGRKNGS